MTGSRGPHYGVSKHGNRGWCGNRFRPLGNTAGTTWEPVPTYKGNRFREPPWKPLSGNHLAGESQGKIVGQDEKRVALSVHLERDQRPSASIRSALRASGRATP